MGIRIPVVLMTLLALLLATGASAKSQLSISMQAEKEVTIDKETKRVKADKVEPGVVIFYTLSYVNSGDEAATNAVLDDPIPKGTVYLAGSAYGEGAEVTFSIDGGKTFKKPSLLNCRAARLKSGPPRPNNTPISAGQQARYLHTEVVRLVFKYE